MKNFFRLFSYNRIIAKINKKFKKEWDMKYPLASGNCGVFAYSFSKFLSSKNIEHSIVVMTYPSHELDIADNISFKILYRNLTPGLHVSVKIGNKLIDYKGVNNISDAVEHFKEECYLSRVIVYEDVIKDNYFLRYVKKHCCFTKDELIFDDIIKTYFN